MSRDCVLSHRLLVAQRKRAAGAVIARRRLIAATGVIAALAAATSAAAPETLKVLMALAQAERKRGVMEIKRSGSQPSAKGPADYFTGSVRIDSRFQGSEPARVGGAFVTFEPSARTAWHTHPLGQTLIVTSGSGWVQSEGGAKEEIRPGDLVWIPPGEKHWHGAAATTAMTHIAIAEALDGKNVDWMEKVSDDEYLA